MIFSKFLTHRYTNEYHILRRRIICRRFGCSVGNGEPFDIYACKNWRAEWKSIGCGRQDSAWQSQSNHRHGKAIFAGIFNTRLSIGATEWEFVSPGRPYILIQEKCELVGTTLSQQEYPRVQFNSLATVSQ